MLLARACALLLDDNTDVPDLRQVIFKCVPQNRLAESVSKVNELARPQNNNFHDEMVEQYGRGKRFLPAVLRDLHFRAAPAGEHVLAAIHYLAELNGSKKRILDDAPEHIITGPWKAVASRFEKNSEVHICNEGKYPSLTISCLEKQEEPPSLLRLNNRIKQLLPPVDLTELLLEIDARIGFTHEFAHVSESGARAQDLHISLCAVLMAEACNIGLEPLIKHNIPALTRHRLSWVAGEAVFWRVNKSANYGVLDKLARGYADLSKTESQWDEMMRTAGSLKLGTIHASELIRSLLKSSRPSGLAQAIMEVGRVNKTLYLLNYIDDEDYRRRILTQLNRGEGRHAVARAICYGQRGEIRKRYREGQEDQLGALGLVTNAVVLWNTLYMQEALSWIRRNGEEIIDEDIARLSPLMHGHINMLGHYIIHSRCQRIF